MKAGAAGGAPRRARRPRQAARYGIRWRARDMARSAGAALARLGLVGAFGMCWTVMGFFLLLVTCTIPARRVPWWAYLEFSVMCAVGIALWLAARRKARR